MKEKDKELNEIIGGRIRELCRIHNLTLEEFSERCGIPVKKLEKHLNGEGAWFLNEFSQITAAFNVSAEYMLGNFPYPFPAPSTPEMKKIYEMAASMSIDELYAFIEKLQKELQEAE